MPHSCHLPASKRSPSHKIPILLRRKRHDLERCLEFATVKFRWASSQLVEPLLRQWKIRAPKVGCLPTDNRVDKTGGMATGRHGEALGGGVAQCHHTERRTDSDGSTGQPGHSASPRHRRRLPRRSSGSPACQGRRLRGRDAGHAGHGHGLNVPVKGPHLADRERGLPRRNPDIGCRHHFSLNRRPQPEQLENRTMDRKQHDNRG
jgi:hypothetical protein